MNEMIQMPFLFCVFISQLHVFQFFYRIIIPHIYSESYQHIQAAFRFAVNLYAWITIFHHTTHKQL